MTYQGYGNLNEQAEAGVCVVCGGLTVDGLCPWADYSEEMQAVDLNADGRGCWWAEAVLKHEAAESRGLYIVEVCNGAEVVADQYRVATSITQAEHAARVCWPEGYEFRARELSDEEKQDYLDY